VTRQVPPPAKPPAGRAAAATCVANSPHPAARPAASLVEDLLATPSRFSFDAGVAVMMRASGRSDTGAAIRFEAALGLAFVPGDLAAIRRTESGGFAVRTGILGLTGPGGILPRPYSEMANGQARQRSGAFSAFLDLVAQRSLAQFAQAGIKYRPHRAADVAAIADEGLAEPSDETAAKDSEKRGASAPRDGLREALLALVGYADPGLLARLSPGPEPLLYYAGLFAARPRSAERLVAMLAEWLGRPVEAEQFAGTWLDISRDQMTRLPLGGAGQFNRLGVDAVAGARAWDIGSRIALRVGPLNEAEFRALLPGGRLLAWIGDLVRAYLGQEISVVINPVLAAAAVPESRLDAGASCLLGWTGWLPVSGGRKEDAREARFRL
jgi:type VI secretion system protein ImpH